MQQFSEGDRFLPARQEGRIYDDVALVDEYYIQPNPSEDYLRGETQRN